MGPDYVSAVGEFLSHPASAAIAGVVIGAGLVQFGKVSNFFLVLFGKAKPSNGHYISREEFERWLNENHADHDGLGKSLDRLREQQGILEGTVREALKNIHNDLAELKSARQ